MAALLLQLDSTAALLRRLNHAFIIGPKRELCYGGDPGRASRGRAAAALALAERVVRSVTLGALEVLRPSVLLSLSPN